VPIRRALRIFITALPLVATGLATGLTGTATAKEVEPVKAWISLEPGAGGHSQFVGHASATEPFEGRFELIGERRGAGGVSHVTQGGAVRISDGQSARLSQLSFGDVATATHYSVQLRILKGDKIVGSAEITK
jgi:hypothetical protein